MKILFDSQIFDAQKYGGISRYFMELYSHLSTSHDIECKISVRYTENEYLKHAQGIEHTTPKNFFTPYSKLKKIFRILVDFFDTKSNLAYSKKLLQEQDFDLFHPTYYSPYFLKLLQDKPFVVTVHDMIHEKYPQYFRFDFGRIARNKKKLITAATKIIAVSENTKRDICNFYAIPPEKIHVIYHGNSLISDSNTSFATDTLPQTYILFVGARNGYKNFAFFIESVSEILRTNKEMNVVVAGGHLASHFSKREMKLFKMLGIQNQVHSYSVNDTQLAFLYAHAQCFVFPTLYEGFGIPILEAFSCECPVVASSTSSLPEVGGDAALYFDPTDTKDLIEKITWVLSDEKKREEMREKGKEQLKKFSWEKTASMTQDVYHEALETK